MDHLFVNIRNSYQDGIHISQGLINTRPYYISTALAHARRSIQDFLAVESIALISESDRNYKMSSSRKQKGRLNSSVALFVKGKSFT